EARTRLERLIQPGDESVPPVLSPLFGYESRSESASFGSFAEAPSRIGAWLDQMVKETDELSSALRQISVQPRTFWQELEAAFWRLWERRLPGEMIRSSAFRNLTLVELIHAARHGQVPVVPPRGGRLSVAQWSRIFGIARTLVHSVASDVPDHAARSLGIEELSDANANLRDPNAKIVVFRPQSARSDAWNWPPEPGIRAVALMPDDVALADRNVLAGMPETDDPPLPDNAVDAKIRDAVKDLRSRILIFPIKPGIMEFIELGGDVSYAMASRMEKLTSVTSRTYFGFGVTEPEV